MTDRELLEKAAKAAGYDVQWHPMKPGMREMFWHTNKGEWNPLTDDGDALRLAVKLGMSLDTALGQTLAIVRIPVGRDCVERHESNPYAATRRAIVRAAASMAEGTQEGGAA